MMLVIAKSLDGTRVLHKVRTDRRVTVTGKTVRVYEYPGDDVVTLYPDRHHITIEEDAE